jgi:hypothetical protein
MYIMSAGKNVLIEKLRLNVLQRFSSSMSSLFVVAIIIKIDAILIYSWLLTNHYIISATSERFLSHCNESRE